MQNIIYVISVVTFIFLGIATFIDLEKLKNFVINMSNDLFDSKMFLLTIFIGMITFSIPFLWNAYQNILDKKKHVTGEKIENILAKEFYHKSVRFFEYFLQYPVGIIVFLGLFIVPILFPLKIAITFLMVVFFYFFFLPQIFQMIENKSSTNLKDFLLHKEAEETDVLKIFKELWQRKDDEIEQEFSIKPVHVFEFFSQKIDRLLEKSYLDIAREYFNDFLARIHNRSIIFLVMLTEIFPKILEWHYRIWEKEYEYLSRKDKLREWSSYGKVSRILNSILEKIEERSLREHWAFGFFEPFKKHAEEYKKKFVESEKGKKYYYIESLLSIFYQVFFENIEASSERYDIWEHYFPKEWKITKTHLEDNENIIAQVSLNKFLHWTQERMWQTKEEFDRKLDDVASNLFHEIEPRVWVPVLIFCLSPHVGDNRVKSVIERPWNFGGAGRVFFGCGEEDLLERMESQIESEKRNTFELATVLFKDTFSKENLERYIEDLKGLEGKYKDDSLEEDKRAKLLGIFTGMLDFLQTT